AEQTLEPARVPGWLRGVLPPAFVTVGAALALLAALAADGLSLLELGWVGLFAFLFALSATGFFTALAGAFPGPSRKTGARSSPSEAPEPSAPLPRTALLMPIYHESAEQVFAAVAAMRESLLARPGGEAFEIFVLSDSRDPVLAAEEERAFRRVSAG